MQTIKNQILVILIASVVGISVAAADQDHHDAADETESHNTHEAGHGDESHGHHGHKNILAVFVGVTGENRNDRAFTLGLEYNRWVTDNFGIGLGVERAYGPLDLDIITLPFAWRSGHWKFFAGPGLENSDHHDGRDFLMRAGVERAFMVGNTEVAPKIMLDYVNDEFVVVVGVAIGRGF